MISVKCNMGVVKESGIRNQESRMRIIFGVKIFD